MPGAGHGPSPKVTVYVVSRNYGRFLSDAVESVLRQQYDDWELLLFDDGSVDETAEIMQLYRGDPRTRIFSTPGIGLPAICNRAIREARGQYLMRLDGDDVLDENALLVLASHLDRNPDIALVFPDYYLVDEGGEILSHERRRQLSEANRKMEPPPNGACTMIRKSVLESIGGYREDLGAQDGLDLWVKVRDRYRVANVNLPLFSYRRHGQNLTNSRQRILAARRQIQKEAIGQDLDRFRPLMAVIPCRQNYDFRQDLWAVELNGKSLLQRKIELCLGSSLFDRVVVACDSDAVLPTLAGFSDDRLAFFRRDPAETLRSRSIVGTLSRVAQKFDPAFSGVTVLCYLPSPFVALGSLEEAVCTLVFNDADSSVGVEEIKEPVFCRTEFGLKPVNPVNGLRSDFNFAYREANIAIATRNSNLKEGSLIGPRPINFVVVHEECFFIDSEKKLQIAHILDAR